MSGLQSKSKIKIKSKKGMRATGGDGQLRAGSWPDKTRLMLTQAQ